MSVMTTTEIQWQIGYATSGLHAAEAMARDMTLVDPKLAEAIGPQAAEIHREVVVTRLPPHDFWSHLVPLSVRNESRFHLANLALKKAYGPEGEDGSRGDRIADQIMELEAGLKRSMPDLLNQLELRARPLREQWDARGPGLLRLIGQLTHDNLIPGRAEVLLVLPAVGGAGTAHLSYNSVRIEAVLANPMEQLPEVVRLAWLVSQLNNDIPIYSEAIHARRVGPVSALAMLPAALTAAEAVELARFDEATIQLALDGWGIKTPPHVEDPVELILSWWDTYQESKLTWAAALTALDQMIG